MGEMRSLDGLLQLAEDKSRAGRLAREIAANDLIGGRNDQLSDAQTQAMGEILVGLLGETEAAIRQRVRSTSDDDPKAKSLAHCLATRDIGVAVEILSHSPVLRDLDLAETIYHRIIEHQLPAGRPVIGMGIVARLGTTAGLQEAAAAFAAEVSERHEPDGRPRVSLVDLEQEPAERTVWAVAAAVRMHALLHYEADARFVDDAIEGAGKSLIDDTYPIAGRAGIVPEMVKILAARAMIDEVLLLEALDEGQIYLFDALLAAWAQVRRILVRRLFYEPGGECLAILCRHVGISRNGFTRLFAASQPARPPVDPARIDGGADLEHALTCFDGLSKAAVERIVRRWRRDPHYLDGLRLVAQPVP